MDSTPTPAPAVVAPAGASTPADATAERAADTPYRYTAALAGRIEVAWQDKWEMDGTFHAPNPAGPWADPAAVAGRQKLYVLDMFPYPSGAGLHVGHPLGYIATDVFARYQRMRGKNVLHCLGYDAFGLPAEQYAVQTGQHPRKTTEDNIVTMRRQLRRLGLGHDDRRAVATTDEAFYRWTQWIFLTIYQSWYDERVGRARPVTELVAELESGSLPTPDGRSWHDLTSAEQRAVLDSRRLAYVSQAPVNWCPGLGTVLANEEVTADGRSERGNFPVFKRDLSQWMMRITAYADRLVDDLDRLDWPDKVKVMQRNWIGRSFGARVSFPIAAAAAASQGLSLEVFTTRPDTLFGATFMVLAPEHPLVDELAGQQWSAGTAASWTGGEPTPRAAVAAYRRDVASRSELERQSEGRAKTGVFTGAFATNPVNGAQLPVFVADYVLMGYGTGAIMAVPGQDARDWEFAERFGLPVIRTVQPPPDHPQDQAYAGDGPAINSANDEVSLDGLRIAEAKSAIVAWLEAKGYGQGAVTYKLRDWLFSRQRYWGEPFPIVYDQDGNPHALPESLLPVTLPDVPDYAPRTFDPDDAGSTPEPPLSRAGDWVEVDLDLGDGLRRYRRETNTMPNWAGSCWYELRYLDPANHERLVDPEVERYWMGPSSGPEDATAGTAGTPRAAGTPGTSSADHAAQQADPGGADLYVGGVEHAVLHLLYARFWHKVLHDLGHVSSDEPFRRLFNQGYIQAFAYRDERGQPVPAAEVEENPRADGSSSYSWRGRPVTREYGKMGKSLKNVVTPDEMFESYGADTFRVYEMSMGPLDVSRPWETRAVVGAQRFLQRLWRNVVDEQTGELRVDEAPADLATRRLLHKTIAAVGEDYAALRFNTAVAKLIELNNRLTKLTRVPREVAEPLVLMVAPLAPHISEELWQLLGHAQTLTFEPFPAADPAMLLDETVTCVVQVNGKVRDRLQVSAAATEDELRELALSSGKVMAAVGAATVRTVIVRRPALVNVVSSA